MTTISITTATTPPAEGGAIKVFENDGEQWVDARTLHGRLGISTQFCHWVERNFGDYVEGEDYIPQDIALAKNGDGTSCMQTPKDYCLSINMAKHLAMLAKTPEGKRIRNYLIKIEEAWNTPDMVIMRGYKALMVKADELTARNAELSGQLAEAAPKVEFYDAVADSDTAIDMQECAAILNKKGFGRNNLFDFLRKQKILNERNLPYREYQERGYFRVIEQTYKDGGGKTKIRFKVLAYQRGVDYIRRVIDQQTEPTLFDVKEYV